MSKSKFFDKIHLAKEEREVEDVYNEGITLYFLKDEPGSTITHPYKCDGMIDKGLFLKLLIEYKYDEELHNAVSRAKVLIQVIYYLKQFELNGERLPNVVMVGDKDEVFVMHTNPLLNYLDEKVDWSIAPSNAHEKNPEMLLKISQDKNINPYVYDINDVFSFKEVADKIIEIATNTIRKVRVTEHNISKIFDDFTKRVLKDSGKISANDLVGIFVNSIIDRENCYQHPNNKNTLVCFNKQYQINGSYYETFFKHFEKEYSPSDKNKFTEISDRLIEDTKRRRNGEFFTPTMFTDYAHKLLSDELGEDWKERYVVWDSCWGTGNLTRDYLFKELYASTLEQSELDCGCRYNPEATKFVFDFLNDDFMFLGERNGKLPVKLYEALEQNKPIVFFINPPYATAGNKGGTVDSKEGVAKTKANFDMHQDNMGRCAESLYAQFLYRILYITREFRLTNVHIGLFSPTGFLCGASFDLFRKHLFDNFTFSKGVMFNASYFSDVADNWGISFSVWKSGKSSDRNDFKYQVIDSVDNEIKITGEKTIYNLDNSYPASKWVRELTNGMKTFDAPQMTSALNIKNEGKTMNGSLTDNAIGYFFNDSNNVRENPVGVAMFTSCYTKGHGLSVTRENLLNCCSLLAARKVIYLNWVNQNDQYIKPDTDNAKWKSYQNDSLIYSLFHFGGGQASNQSSLRNVMYKGTPWNIKNEFFYMSKDEIMKMANDNGFDFTYNDARVSSERYVYTLLKELLISDEARKVLNQAVELTKKTFKFRKMFNEQYPEYQVMNWDCGWYQVKAMVKEYFPDDLDDFTVLYKQLEEKLTPLVYELGFLK